jgi:hypothetical protein
MNMQTKAVLVAGLVMIAGTAGAIISLQATIKIAAPGVKLVPEPVYDEDGKLASSNRVFFPLQSLDYTFKGTPLARKVTDMCPPDTTYGQGHYIAPDGFSVQVSAVLMGADRTSLHKPYYCLQGTGWNIQKHEETTVPIPRPHSYLLPVNRLFLVSDKVFPDGSPARGVFVYWFVSKDKLATQHGARMWSLGLELVRTGELERWAYLIFFAPCKAGTEEVAFERIKTLIAATVPEFQLAAGPSADDLSQPVSKQ